ncbi:MAG: hypothetical protein FJ149_02325 [Euryarchaeota archaeon]|nr:hypothetical protein [Euryarchaeota archaeon]
MMSMTLMNWKALTKPYPWSFMGFMVLVFLVPKFYDLANVYWIGKIGFEALAITEQYEFLGVSIEVINEMIPFGILALVARNWRDRDTILRILKSGLVLQLAFSMAFMLLVLGFLAQFVNTIGTPPEIVETTRVYLGLKGLALPFEALSYLLLMGIKSMRKGKEALHIVIFSVILNMMLDLFLISDRGFSLHLGIRGVAIGYVISKVALTAVSLAYLGKILGIDWRSFIGRIDFKGMVRPIFRIGGWTGADSLTRNLGYIGTLMVLNLIGTNEFGGYGLVMWVMWTLLIPVLALAEGTSVAVGNLYGEKKYDGMKKVILTSILFSTLIMVGIGLIGIVAWAPISRFFNPNPDLTGFSIAAFEWLMIPYVLFAIGSCIKSLFFGTGETRYILYISLVANVGIIVPFVLLVRAGYIAATFENVMAQFFIVFVEDLVVTALFANRLFKRISKTSLLPGVRKSNPKIPPSKELQ